MTLLSGAVLVVAIMLVGSLLNQSRPNVEPAPTGATPSGSAPGSYRNEDYQVPPVDLSPPALPRPETLDEVEELLERNPLYRQSVARPVRCEVTDVNIRSVSRPALEAHLNQMMGCLMKVWGPTLEAAGWVPVRPSVTVYSAPVKSRCGDTRMSNASYCGGDQQIYVATDVLSSVPGSVNRNRYMVETILAHEFGHAVQARTGILTSSLVLENRASSERAKNLISRRTELQADCFAGMFLSSIAQSVSLQPDDLTKITKLGHAIGDDVLSGKANIDGDHGLGASRQQWMRQGLSSTEVSACNSFVAPASAVR